MFVVVVGLGSLFWLMTLLVILELSFIGAHVIRDDVLTAIAIDDITRVSSTFS